MQRDMRRLILSLVPVSAAIAALVAPQDFWERTGVAGALRDLRDGLGLGEVLAGISAQTAVVVISALLLFLINLAPIFGRGGPPPPQSR
jgi:hypothetical protein